MALFAIADLHLPLGVDKPMDIFGNNWENYVERLKVNWKKRVSDLDYVVIPGDLSWAMKLSQAKADFDFIDNLPGVKIVLKGNHDYWWDTLSKLGKFKTENCYKDIHFLQNNSYLYNKISICGTRGWVCPGSDGFSEFDQKIYSRELERAKLSIESAKGNGEKIIFFMHYPPAKSSIEPDEGFAKIFSDYNIKMVVYGHIHGSGHNAALKGKYYDCEYILASSDYLNFEPLKICD